MSGFQCFTRTLPASTLTPFLSSEHKTHNFIVGFLGGRRIKSYYLLKGNGFDLILFAS